MKKQIIKRTLVVPLALGLLVPQAVNVLSTPVTSPVVAHAVTQAPLTQLQKASAMVQVAEQINFPEYTKLAKTAVSALPASTDKAYFEKRLSVLQDKQTASFAYNRLNWIANQRMTMDLGIRNDIVNGITDPVLEADLMKQFQTTADRLRMEDSMRRLSVSYSLLNDFDFSMVQSDLYGMQDPLRKADLTKQLNAQKDRYYFEDTRKTLMGADLANDETLLASAKKYGSLITDPVRFNDLNSQIGKVETRLLHDNAYNYYLVAKYTMLGSDVDLFDQAVAKLKVADPELSNDVTKVRDTQESQLYSSLLVNFMPKSDYEVDLLKSTVGNAFKGVNKMNAFNRLEVLKQDQLVKKAQLRVSQAQSSRLAFDVQVAKDTVNLVTNTTVKADLTKKLNAIVPVASPSPFSLVSGKVNQAQSTREYADLEKAKLALNTVSLPSTDKAKLQSMLDNAFDRFYESLTVSNLSNAQMLPVDSAQYKVATAKTTWTNIKNPVLKASLQSKVYQVEDEVDAKNVEKRLNLLRNQDLRSSTVLKTEFSLAKQTVAQLHDSMLKASLTNKIAVVERDFLYDHAYAVSKATTVGANDILLNYAQDLINQVTDPIAKAELQKRFNAGLNEYNLKQFDNRIQVMKQGNKTYADLSKAQQLLAKLPADMLSYVTPKYNQMSDETIGDELFKRFSLGSQLQPSDIARFDSLLPQIKNPEMRSQIQSKYAVMKQEYDFNRANKYVQAVEASKLNTDYVTAKSEVGKLPASSMKDSLNARLAKVAPYLRS